MYKIKNVVITKKVNDMDNLNEIKNLDISKQSLMNSGYSKKFKFFSGFFFTLLLLYQCAFFIVCGYYGFSGFGLILLFSIYAHVALFPFALYAIGGVVFTLLPNHDFKSLNSKLWKWLIIGCVVCFGIVCLSELAHHFGILHAQFKLTWK